MAPFGCVNPITNAMTPIGQFLRTTIGPSKGVSLRVVNLKVVVAIRVVVAVRAVGAIKGEKERHMGADVGRSAQKRLRQKK